MNKQLPLAVKIVASLFLITGLYNLIIIFIFLLRDLDSYENKNFFEIISQAINIVPLVYALANVLVGRYLFKLQYWAYSLGLILTIFSLGSYIYIFMQGERPYLTGPLLSIAILILLIKGKEDFKKHENF